MSRKPKPLFADEVGPADDHFPRWLWITMLVVVGSAVLIAIYLALSLSAVTQSDNNRYAVHPIGAAATASSSVPTSASPSASPSVPPVRGKLCASSGGGPYDAVAVGNTSTTCAFATAVHDAYVAQGGNGSPLTMNVVSPANHRQYSMSCVGSTPVTCTGGNNANVLLAYQFAVQSPSASPSTP